MFYFYDTNAALQNGVQQLLVGTTVLRLACIWLNLGPVLRVLISSVFHGTIAQQRVWFAGVHNDLISDQLLWQVGKGLYKVSMQFTRHLPNIVKVSASLWMMFSAFALIVFAYFVDWVLKKRRENAQAVADSNKRAAKEWTDFISQFSPQEHCSLKNVYNGTNPE